METKYIQRTFATLKQAEDFLFDLYGKYNNANTVSSPMFGESGTYRFAVSDPLSPTKEEVKYK